jgi:hypothetical protein
MRNRTRRSATFDDKAFWQGQQSERDRFAAVVECGALSDNFELTRALLAETNLSPAQIGAMAAQMKMRGRPSLAERMRANPTPNVGIGAPNLSAEQSTAQGWAKVMATYSNPGTGSQKVD